MTTTTTILRRTLIHSDVPLSITPLVRQPVSFFASSTGDQPKKPPIPEWKKPRPPIPPPPGLEDFKLRDEVNLDPSIHRKPLESHRQIVEDEQWARLVEREFYWRPYKPVAIGLAALLVAGVAVKFAWSFFWALNDVGPEIYHSNKKIREQTEGDKPHS